MKIHKLNPEIKSCFNLTSWVAFALMVFLLGLGFLPVLSGASQETLSQEHKRFYRTDSELDVGEILGLEGMAGKQIQKVTVTYNMVRSNLEADWLYNGQIIGHTVLAQGLGKQSSFAYNRMLPAQVKVRFTGPSGQVQVTLVSAAIAASPATYKYMMPTAQKPAVNYLPQLKLEERVVVDPSTASSSDKVLAQKVRYNLMKEGVIKEKDCASIYVKNGQVQVKAFTEGEKLQEAEIRKIVQQVRGVKSVSLISIDEAQKILIFFPKEEEKEQEKPEEFKVIKPWRPSIILLDKAGLDSLTLSAQNVQAGVVVTGTVILKSKAPEEGISVSISSDNTAAVTVPEVVVVTSGRDRASFEIKTNRGLGPTTVTLTAALGNITRAESLSIMPGKAPDIEVVSWAHSPSSPKESDRIMLEAEFQNSGDASAWYDPGSPPWSAKIEGIAGVPQESFDSILYLEPQKKKKVSFVWDPFTIPAGEHTAIIIMNVNEKRGEWKIDNNQQSFQINITPFVLQQTQETQFLDYYLGGNAAQFGRIVCDSSGTRLFQVGNRMVHFYCVNDLSISYETSVALPISGIYKSVEHIALSPEGKYLWVLTRNYIRAGYSEWDLFGIDVESKKIIDQESKVVRTSDTGLLVAGANGQTEVYILNPNWSRVDLYRPDDSKLIEDVLPRPNIINWGAKPLAMKGDGNDLYVAWERYNSEFGKCVVELIRYDIRTKEITGGPWTTNLEKDDRMHTNLVLILEEIEIGKNGKVYVTVTTTQKEHCSRIIAFDTNSGNWAVSTRYWIDKEEGMVHSLAYAGGALRVTTTKGKFLTLHPDTLGEIKREDIPLASSSARNRYLVSRPGTFQLFMSSATLYGSVLDKSTVQIVIPCTW